MHFCTPSLSFSFLPLSRFGTEPSVISEKNNGGRTADAVSHYDSAWYPRVWPSVSDTELQQMQDLARERLPDAIQISNVRKRMTRPRK